VKFWDSSAVVPLLVDEPFSSKAEQLLADDSDIVVWWGSPVECASAVARRERANAIDAAEAARAVSKLSRLADGWLQVSPGENLRDQAVRLVQVHDLRAADALQLSAGLAAAEHRPRTLDFVTLDGRLALAARREGFSVLGD
jgi:predicted nucleic acid-binding protein